PSVIQELWDRQWSRSGRVLLILCGSYIGFMEREVLGQRSPLFGRRTAQILLRPFNHLEAARFHPRLSTVDQARVYAVCGGVPAYLLAFDGARSVEQNLVTRVLDENAALAREPEFLLREELRDLAPYHSVLMALAQGKNNPAHLAKSTGIDVRGLNYHLNTLVELGYVQRRHPVTEAEPSTRSVRYALDDPLLRFWFRFVFPHQSVLRLLGPERGFAEVVRPELDAYFGRCFERLCRESLPLLYLREGIRAPFTVGEYWDADVQVDVVGVRQDNWTDLGECKWGHVTSLAALTAELDEKIHRYPNARNATIGRRLFLRKSPAKSGPIPPGLRVHTLQELYGLEAETQFSTLH
ncbi:MAG: ATP-binding protein, partial [Verrucomicrobia bacterium]|nr:ATP-binding protein [Verrucomicrobiota bacterium]